MKRIVIRNSTELRDKPNGKRIRNLLKGEIIKSVGMPWKHKNKLWIKVEVLHGPKITGYVILDDTEQLQIRRSMI